MKGHFFSRKSPNWLKSLGAVPSLTLYHICILICIFLHNINLLKLQENLALFKIFGSTLAQIFVCSVSFQFLHFVTLSGSNEECFLKNFKHKKMDKIRAYKSFEKTGRVEFRGTFIGFLSSKSIHQNISSKVM